MAEGVGRVDLVLTVPPDALALDPGERANVARVHDRLLGGSHNFAVDRELAAEIVARRPREPEVLWQTRLFLRRVTRRCVALGVHQFLDLACGLPTVQPVHEVARRWAPDARVAYVDRDPVTVSHARHLLAGVGGVTVTRADLRDPAAVLGAPGVAGLFDPARPVAVLMLGVLPLLTAADRPADVVAGYRRALVPGGALALSHLGPDGPGHADAADDAWFRGLRAMEPAADLALWGRRGRARERVVPVGVRAGLALRGRVPARVPAAT